MSAALAAAATAGLLLASPPSHVMDSAEVIPPATEADLDRRLAAFEDQHKIEIVVATFASLMGRPEHVAAAQTTRDWAIGSRTARRAVLISFWRDDRAVRIDVTDSLSQMSGARAAEIVDRVMIPAFRQGRIAEGLDAGAGEVMSFLGANPWRPQREISRGPSGGLGKVLGGAGSVLLVIVFLGLRVMMAAAGFGGGYYRSGWGYRRSSPWGSSRSSWGGGSRRSGGGSSRSSGGGGFSGRGASGRW